MFRCKRLSGGGDAMHCIVIMLHPCELCCHRPGFQQCRRNILSYFSNFFSVFPFFSMHLNPALVCTTPRSPRAKDVEGNLLSCQDRYPIITKHLAFFTIGPRVHEDRVTYHSFEEYLLNIIFFSKNSFCLVCCST